MNDLVGLVGRRQAVRYLSLGLLSVTLAACSGRKSEGGVKGAAFVEFIAGRWTYAADDQTGQVTIDKGKTWKLVADAGWQSTGSWSLSGGEVRLESEDYEGPSTLHGVPDQMGDGYAGEQRWDFWALSSPDATFNIRSSFRSGLLTLEVSSGEGQGVIELRRAT